MKPKIQKSNEREEYVVDNFNNNHSEMDAESIKKAIADIDAKLARLGEQLSDSAPAAPAARVVSTSSQKKMFVSAFLVDYLL